MDGEKELTPAISPIFLPLFMCIHAAIECQSPFHTWDEADLSTVSML